MPVSRNGRRGGKSPGMDRLGTDRLGMDERISRRDFLNSTLLASGSLLMSAVTPLQLLGQEDDWTGYGGVGDYSKSNGNTFEIVAEGHRIRANEFERLPAAVIDTAKPLTVLWWAVGSVDWRPRCSFSARPGRIVPAWCWTIIRFLEGRPSATSSWWMVIA